jgi:cytoskeleton protein RodZ
MNGVHLMSESSLLMDVDKAHAVPSAPQISAGALLRQAREAAGLHVAALAVAIKVPLKKLEALESDRLDLLPDAVFARALASSMCRALKVDPVPILERLPLNVVPRLQPVEQSMSIPFHTPGERVHSSALDKLSRPVVLMVLALLVAALIMILFPSMQTGKDIPLASMPGQRAVEPAVASVIAETPALVSRPFLEVSSSLPQTTASVAVALAVAPAAGVSEVPVSGASAATLLTTKVVTPMQVSGLPEGLVVLKAKGTSWVEVTDGRGVVQVRKTLAAGEVIGASGVLPLSVVVGRADNTEVQVRGKDYDLSRIVRDNVARFEVK